MSSTSPGASASTDLSSGCPPSWEGELGNSGIVATGWPSAGPYLLAPIAAELAVLRNLRTGSGSAGAYVWICLLAGALAFAGSRLAGPGHFWLSYGLLAVAGPAMYAPYGPFFAWVSEMLPQNVAGGALALINSMGALGSFVRIVSAVGWLNGATGGPGASYLFSWP